MKKRCIRCRLEYPEEETECEICRLPLVPVEEETPKEEPKADAQDEPKSEAAGEPPKTQGRGAPYHAPFVSFFKSAYVVLAWILIGIFFLISVFSGGTSGLGIFSLIITLVTLLVPVLVAVGMMAQGHILGLMLDTNRKLSEGGEAPSKPYESRVLRFVCVVYPIVGGLSIVLGVLYALVTWMSKDSTLAPLGITTAISGVFMLLESQKIGLLMDSNRKAIR